MSRFNVFFCCKRIASSPLKYSSSHFQNGYSTITGSSVNEQSSKPTPTVKVKKSKKVTKSFTDLPAAYVNPAGFPALPLEEFTTSSMLKPTIGSKGAVEAVENSGECHADATANQDVYDTNDTNFSGQKSHEKKQPLMRQILTNLKKYSHCLLLTRIGQFYESYFDQAKEVSELLNIKLTSKKWNGTRIAMCGFPVMHLDRHLKTLVQQEKRFVAMCEEFSQNTTNGKVFERRISRIITPGTLIDESFLNPSENNYILAVSPDILDDPKIVGLAWTDVSTGQFFSKHCALENLQDELARVGPLEVVLHSSLSAIPEHPIISALNENICTISFFDTTLDETASSDGRDTAEWEQHKLSTSALERDESRASLTANGLTGGTSDLQTMSDTEYPATSLPREENMATQLLKNFLQENLLEHMPVLDSPVHESSQQLMQIDAHTIHALEIRENDYETGVKGSLLSNIKRTVTTGGARLLARWLGSPSTCITEINFRQSLVAIFHQRTHFRADLTEILKEIDDMERLCQKFTLGRAEFCDLLSIHNTIQNWSDIKKRIIQERLMESSENLTNFNAEDWCCLDALLNRLANVDELSRKISNAIVIPSESAAEDESDVEENLQINEDTDTGTEDLLSLSDKPVNRRLTINPKYSRKIENLHSELTQLTERQEELQNELREKYNAPSLTLRSSSGNGFFVHLSRARRDKARIDEDPAFLSLGGTMSTRMYFHKAWYELGNNIIQTSAQLELAEKEIFSDLRLEVIEKGQLLRQNSQVIDELDVAISFSILAVEMNFVRPTITDNVLYHVSNGRHPTVEMGLLKSGREFVPNDVHMDENSNMHIITGPNMAGKSTLLRQTALIAILAQVGSFVPADNARLGVVDKLFSRIGARDDLFRDRSTFMVEMLETADILRRATEKSLVIMDEVGRGTTVKDGLAIAYSALHHLATVNKSRCLFATHFHELAEMVGNTDGLRGTGTFHKVRFYCSDVDDAGDGHFAYAYRLQPGINRESHGIKVAGLAGMPDVAIAVATQTLTWLNSKGNSDE